jgi:hypothetical protein
MPQQNRRARFWTTRNGRISIAGQKVGAGCFIDMTASNRLLANVTQITHSQPTHSAEKRYPHR